jgi:hypothetical protein
MSFSSLPTDIIHHILSYNETLKIRNGKYMIQISKTDKRYKLLLKIKRRFVLSWPNCYYVLHVNGVLIIRVIMNSITKSIQYEYYFRGKPDICYVPK